MTWLGTCVCQNYYFAGFQQIFMQYFLQSFEIMKLKIVTADCSITAVNHIYSAVMNYVNACARFMLW